MKKYLSILAVTALAVSAFAQGTVSFINNSSSVVKSGTDLATATPIPNAGGFVELLWAPAGAATAAPWNPGSPTSLTAWLAANPGWQAIPTSIKAVGPAPGRFNGSTVIVPTATPGAPITAAVAAWAGNFATFDLAQSGAGAVGISAPFAVATGNPNTTPPGTAGGITAFTGVTALTIIPEPTTLTLAGLGFAALMIFRRRK